MYSSQVRDLMTPDVTARRWSDEVLSVLDVPPGCSLGS